MKTTVVALTLALAFAGSAAAKDWRSVRIATEGAYAPWNATDPSGRLVGFEVDLGRDLCQRAGVECEIIAQDWDGIIPALQQGKYDAIMAGMSITDERLKAIDFAGPYAAEPAAFAARKGSPLAGMRLQAQRIDLDAETAERSQAVGAMGAALRDKVVGVQVSTAQARLMERLWPGIQVRTYDKADTAALDLAAGRIDALLANRSAVEAINRAHQREDLVLFGAAFVRGVLGRGVGVGLRKGDQDLKTLFDRAIADAAQDGTISRLSLQYFGFDVSLGR